MAYSLYAYLDPAILDADIPYWKHYFESQPWLKVPHKGDDFLFTHVKPRLESGVERFVDFMEAVKAADELGYLHELHGDLWNEPSPSYIKCLLVKWGFGEYQDRIKFK